MFEGWNGPEITTFWFAAGALAVALTSLLWQLYFVTRVDRPRLRVRITEGNIQHVHTLRRVVVMTVTNVGRRATVVNNLLLNLDPRPFWRGPFARVFPKKITVAARADEFLQQYNTNLPRTMAPGDEANIYLPRHQVVKMLYEAGHGEIRKIHASSYATTASAKRSRTLKLKPTTDDAAEADQETMRRGPG